MLLVLFAGDCINLQENVTKVKVHLTTGIAEILDHHTDLLGLIDNNIVEIETLLENRIEKFLFVLEEGVFIVSNKGIGDDRIKNQTYIYIYGKRAEQISSETSLERFTKEYNLTLNQFENLTKELEKDKENRSLNYKFAEVEKSLGFLQKILLVTKNFKA